MVKISLIIPLYNVSAYIERCLDSIIGQSFKDFEAIFVNDGSPDNSAEICSSRIANYSNMKLVTKENGGLTSARLFGLSQCSGEYVAFIDSDDYLAPDYLQVLFDNITRFDADVCMCSYFIHDTNSDKSVNLYLNEGVSILQKSDIPGKYMYPQLADCTGKANKLPAYMWLRLYKRELLKEEYFISEREVYLEDLAFSLKIFKSLNRVVVVNKPLYYYCMNPGSLTKKFRQNAWQMMSNLYGIVKSELSGENNKALEARMNGVILYAAHFVMHNATYRDYTSFKDEFHRIRNTETVRQIIKSVRLSELRKAYWILILVMRFNIPLLLYKYNKSRMHL